MPPDVRLIAILDPAPLGAKALDAARAAEAGGVTMLQVRMKDSGAGDVLRWTTRLLAALRIPVWVNDRLDVARIAGAGGVHLGQDDLPLERARALAPRPFGLGISVGTAAEAERALGADPDYWSIGSVYATGSKPDAGAPLGPRGFARLAARAPARLPCVAIGGVTADRVPELKRAGAAGVAVINAIFGAEDVERAARVLRDRIDA
ncbi:MAG TPA: thiamine phosphate synthase [Gemmatimonadales bacterium]|nr:thiamine phosphate synthase [Gemmatimonadales bacterium]